MEGYLLKWVNYFSGWQKRYFKIQEGQLSYYIDKDQVYDTCKGSFSLSQCIIDSSFRHNDRIICITVQNNCTLYIQAETKECKQKWINALLKGKNFKSNTKNCMKSIDYKNLQMKSNTFYTNDNANTKMTTTSTDNVKMNRIYEKDLQLALKKLNEINMDFLSVVRPLQKLIDSSCQSINNIDQADQFNKHQSVVLAEKIMEASSKCNELIISSSKIVKILFNAAEDFGYDYLCIFLDKSQALINEKFNNNDQISKDIKYNLDLNLIHSSDNIFPYKFWTENDLNSVSMDTLFKIYKSIKRFTENLHETSNIGISSFIHILDRKYNSINTIFNNNSGDIFHSIFKNEDFDIKSSTILNGSFYHYFSSESFPMLENDFFDLIKYLKFFSQLLYEFVCCGDVSDYCLQSIAQKSYNIHLSKNLNWVTKSVLDLAIISIIEPYIILKALDPNNINLKYLLNSEQIRILLPPSNQCMNTIDRTKEDICSNFWNEQTKKPFLSNTRDHCDHMKTNRTSQNKASIKCRVIINSTVLDAIEQLYLYFF